MGILEDLRELDTGELFFNGVKAIVAGAIIFFGARHFANRLPKSSDVLPSVMADPIQSEIKDQPAFDKFIDGTHYQLLPRAKYSIRGVVVAKSDSSSWTNISHAKWGDRLNTHDLCVIWGSTASSPFVEDFKFWHGDWTCYFQTSSRPAYESFRPDQISNTHILPADESVYDVVRFARIGDQIELQGDLVDYSINGGPSRNSSLIRTDTGNGACEVMYVTSAQILKPNSPRLAILEKGGLFLGVAGIMAMFFSFFVLPYVKRRQPEDH